MRSCVTQHGTVGLGTNDDEVDMGTLEHASEHVHTVSHVPSRGLPQAGFHARLPGLEDWFQSRRKLTEEEC
jgi:hypothetical protein